MPDSMAVSSCCGSIAISATWITHAWQRRTLSRRISRARKGGHGLHLWEWHGAAEGAGEQVLAWCREVMANSRRPHGVACFDLAVAVDQGGDRRSIHLRRLEPLALWGDGNVLAAVQGILPCVATAEVGVAVALFSWGEAVHAALVN